MQVGAQTQDESADDQRHGQTRAFQTRGLGVDALGGHMAIGPQIVQDEVDHARHADAEQVGGQIGHPTHQQVGDRHLHHDARPVGGRVLQVLLHDGQVLRATSILPRPLAIPVEVVGHAQHDANGHAQVQAKRRVVDIGEQLLLAHPDGDLVDGHAAHAHHAELEEAMPLRPAPANHGRDGLHWAHRFRPHPPRRAWRASACRAPSQAPRRAGCA